MLGRATMEDRKRVRDYNNFAAGSNIIAMIKQPGAVPISPPSLYMDGAAIAKPPPAMRKRTDELKHVPETVPLPPNPIDWIPQEVTRWLKSENLGEFLDVFYANGFVSRADRPTAR